MLIKRPIIEWTLKRFYCFLQQTLVADVNALTCDGEWLDEDKINLEAELLLKTQSPLCLDPSPEVFNIVNHMHFHKNKYRTTMLQRY